MSFSRSDAAIVLAPTIILVLATFSATARDRYSSGSALVPENKFGSMTRSTPDHNGDSPALFYEVLRKSLKKRKTSIEQICPSSDAVARRVLEDYGAIFLAHKKVLPPPVCVFTSDEQVVEFQDRAGYTTEKIGYDEVELQPEAMKQLLKARVLVQ